jgi:hypothetical protein
LPPRHQMTQSGSNIQAVGRIFGECGGDAILSLGAPVPLDLVWVARFRATLFELELSNDHQLLTVRNTEYPSCSSILKPNSGDLFPPRLHLALEFAVSRTCRHLLGPAPDPEPSKDDELEVSRTGFIIGITLGGCALVALGVAVMCLVRR